jgi:hypothetical protein
MLADFVMLIGVASVWELGKTNNFMMSFFPTIITKEIFGRNVAFINFVGKIATIIAIR